MQCYNCRGITHYDKNQCFEPKYGKTISQECAVGENCEVRNSTRFSPPLPPPPPPPYPLLLLRSPPLIPSSSQTQTHQSCSVAHTIESVSTLKYGPNECCFCFDLYACTLARTRSKVILILILNLLIRSVLSIQ